MLTRTAKSRRPSLPWLLRRRRLESQGCHRQGESTSGTYLPHQTRPSLAGGMRSCLAKTRFSLSCQTIGRKSSSIRLINRRLETKKAALHGGLGSGLPARETTLEILSMESERENWQECQRPTAESSASVRNRPALSSVARHGRSAEKAEPFWLKVCRVLLKVCNFCRTGLMQASILRRRHLQNLPNKHLREAVEKERAGLVIRSTSVMGIFHQLPIRVY